MTEDRLEGTYSERIGPVRESLTEQDLDVLWVTDLVNIRYLTGFTGSSAELLVASEESVFITDGRYQEQVREEVRGCSFRIFHKGAWTEPLRQEVEARDWKKIGFEAAHVTVDQLSKTRNLDGLRETVEWMPVTGVVEKSRRAKDSPEIESLQKSSRVVDLVFRDLLSEIREGITERQILRRMLNLLWDHGATGPSFDPIVLFGERSSLPHGQPGDTALREGDWVLLDFGAIVEGYHSDCTRTFVFGDPDELQRERHDLVKAAHDAGIAASVPGAPAKEVDSAARKLIEEAGLAEAFIHGTGHGVGLEIHEAPRVSPSSHDVLEEGAVITIEPGVYFPGWGGIRIEDAVVVREEGPLPLTACDRSIHPR